MREALKHGDEELETAGPVDNQQHHTDQVKYLHKHPDSLHQLQENNSLNV